MALKTFNVEEVVYKKFSDFCKGHGVSMSKQVELFMESMVEEEPEAKQEYLQKLDRIRKGKFMRVDNFASRYGL
jgi:ligand-binding sensor protein